MLKKNLITLLKITVSVALIIFLISRVGLQDILQQFKTTNLWWLVFAISIFTVSNFLGSFQWYLLLKSRGIHLPFGHVLAYYYVGLFFNNFLLGYIGGDAIRIYDISKKSGDSSGAVSSVFMDRFMGFVLLTTLALFSGLLWQNMLKSKTVLFVTIFIFAGWILAFIFLFNEKLGHNVGKFVKLFFSSRIKVKMSEIYRDINSYKHDKKILGTTAFISFVIQFFRILVHFFAALSVGLHGHLKFFFLFIPIVALLASLPISIGGIGIRETSGVALFSQLSGFLPERIVAMEFLAYLIGLLSALPGGIVFMLRREQINLK